MINLLIGATFDTMSSVYFQHIFLSLNLPSTPQMSLTLSVLWSNGIMRDWTTYGPCWSPSLSGDVIPTPHPSALPYYQMASMCSSIMPHTLPAQSLTDNFLKLFSVSFLFLCIPELWLTVMFDMLYLVDLGGSEWTCKEIIVMEVEQQQCMDYRQDLCEEHMISSLIPLLDWT